MSSECVVLCCRQPQAENSGYFCSRHTPAWAVSGECKRLSTTSHTNERMRRAIADFADRIAAEELNAGNGTSNA